MIQPINERKLQMANYQNRTRTQQAQASAPNPPTHVAKVRTGQGENACFERIGVAWAKEDGSLYVRLSGTQIISDGFALYPVEEGGAR
jgi:hypothetical protein